MKTESTTLATKYTTKAMEAYIKPFMHFSSIIHLFIALLPNLYSFIFFNISREKRLNTNTTKNNINAANMRALS